MTWCEGQLLQKPLAYETREIVEEYFISRVNEYESEAGRISHIRKAESN